MSLKNYPKSAQDLVFESKAVFWAGFTVFWVFSAFLCVAFLYIFPHKIVAGAILFPQTK